MRNFEATIYQYKTPSPDMVPVSSLASTMSGQAASPGVNCSHLFLHRPTDFHMECCLKVKKRTFLKMLSSSELYSLMPIWLKPTTLLVS